VFVNKIQLFAFNRHLGSQTSHAGYYLDAKYTNSKYIVLLEFACLFNERLKRRNTCPFSKFKVSVNLLIIAAVGIPLVALKTASKDESSARSNVFLG
jgi:hypothetical protein